MLNVNLLLIDEYRERIFKELEIEPLGFNPLVNERSYEKFQQTIITDLALKVATASERLDEYGIYFQEK